MLFPFPRFYGWQPRKHSPVCHCPCQFPPFQPFLIFCMCYPLGCPIIRRDGIVPGFSWKLSAVPRNPLLCGRQVSNSDSTFQRDFLVSANKTRDIICKHIVQRINSRRSTDSIQLFGISEQFIISHAVHRPSSRPASNCHPRRNTCTDAPSSPPHICKPQPTAWSGKVQPHGSAR